MARIAKRPAGPFIDKAELYRGLCAAHDPISRGAGRGHQVEPDGFPSPFSAQSAQVLDDVAHTLCAVLRPVYGPPQVLDGAIQTQFIPQGDQLIPAGPCCHGVKVGLKP